MTQFMLKNKYLDINIQKGFVPKISGCVEHNQTLIQILRETKAAKEPVQLAFLDIENAFGSAKHNLILAALAWYNVPKNVIAIIKSLYDDCFVSVTTSKWTTKPIQIQKGSLQGGPEAGVLFNVPWNLILTGLAHFMVTLGYSRDGKPISAFADDVNMKTKSSRDMQAALDFAGKLSRWSKSMNFKESKSAIMALDKDGKPEDLELTMNGKAIPNFKDRPFKFLGKLIYPSLKDKDHVTATSKKLSDLLIKTDKVPLDGRKKVWIYQHGILPMLSWDFMMTEICSTKLEKMEGQVTKYLKKWLKMTKSTDPSILYRGKFGLK